MRLLLLLGTLLLPTVASPCHFPAIFNFGDSNSDTGGLSAAFGPVPWPYGETFFKMPAGRYSDGRLIIDFAGDHRLLPHHRKPRVAAHKRVPGLGRRQLQPWRQLRHLSVDDLTAERHAGSRRLQSLLLGRAAEAVLAAPAPFSSSVQTRYVSAVVGCREQWQQSGSDPIKSSGGVFGHLMPKEEHFARALYMFDIGQNDLTALYFQNASATPYLSAAVKELSRVVQVPTDNSEHVDRLVACIPPTAIVLAQKVYERGGRSFWIHNTGPLGCLPYVLVRVPAAAPRLDSSGCSILFNALAEQFNTMLNETVAQLRKHLPLASLILTDIYSVKYSLFRRAAMHGNSNTTTFCEVNLIAELSSSHACAMARLLPMFERSKKAKGVTC
ncbi:hypothetical protein BHM03_00005735 [Ensete ventricosum]|nr:hypothetical protein BHM03_00005735 [Ensete ventricosum]